MKKYTYIVLKSFWIVEKDGRNFIAHSHEERGQKSNFKRNSQYLDYEFPDRDIVQSRITEKLIQKGYIKLISKAKQ